MILTSTRNDILKSTLYASVFSVAINTPAMVYGFMGMNLEHGAEDHETAFYYFLFIGLFVSFIVYFGINFCFKKVLNVYKN